MNNIYKLIVILAFIFTGKSFSQICNPSGNLVIYSNYDGGIITVNCNVNIPNIKIGICTYEAAEIHITGTFSNNVTGVIYAGYNGTNDNCNLGVTTTTIIGSGSQTISIQPNVGYNPVHGFGWPQMVGCYQCDTTTSSGGVCSPDEVVYYFQNAFPGSVLRSHHTQYNCWTPTTFSISAGGNCCIMPAGSSPCVPPPAPVNASTSQTLCAGNSMSIGVTSSTTVFWYPTSVSTTTLGSGTIFNTPTLSVGTYTYYAEAVNSCSASPRTPITLTVLAKPNLNVSGTPSICAGQMATLSVSGANTFTWSTSQTSSLISVSPSSSQVYTVTGTLVFSGCTNTATISVNVVTCTLVHQLNNSKIEFTIFPNPTKNNLNVISSSGKKKIEIADLFGKVVYQVETENAHTTIDTKNLAVGIYIFTIEQNGLKESAKMIVE